MSDDMEKELRELQKHRDLLKKVGRDQKQSKFGQSILTDIQSNLDIEEAQIRAKYGQLSPSEERAFYEKREQELEKKQRYLEQSAVERGYSPDTYQDAIEEEQQEIRERYELPTPIYTTPQPSYTPPVSFSTPSR